MIAGLPYWFALTSEQGITSKFRFASYRLAYQRAQQHGGPVVWFTDSDGNDRRCEHIHGQEGLAAVIIR